MMSPSVEFFAKFIEKELGIVYSQFNQYQLQSRLEDIARSQSLGSVEELYQKAKAGIPSDLRNLILNVATNNETSFFRDPRVFDAISHTILPELLAQAEKGASIRIWSAASSFGQEAYSLGILILDQLALKPQGAAAESRVRIVATDVATHALERAAAAKYAEHEVRRGLTPDMVTKYFRRSGENEWEAVSRLKSLVEFKRLNLLDGFVSMGTFDLILCRNVLIYQSVENKRKVIDRLAAAIKPSGCLVLGAGESLIGLTDSFEPVKREETIFYQARTVAQRKAG